MTLFAAALPATSVFAADGPNLSGAEIQAAIHARATETMHIAAIEAKARQREWNAKPGPVAIVVGVLDASGPRFYKVGSSDLATGRLADEHTIFEIASVSKLFTSLILADMVVKGEVAIDDPVQKYVPDGITVPVFGGHPISLADLSMHRSGLPRDSADKKENYDRVARLGFSTAQLYRAVSEAKLTQIPGKVEYSNLGVSLLGWALAERAGTDFPTLVSTRIFGPLGMADSGFGADTTLRAHRAVGYGDELKPSPDVVSMPGYYPGGGVQSSVSDMLRFLAATMTPKSSALEPAALYMRKPFPDKAEALAWLRMYTKKGVIWQHTGKNLGFSSFFGFNSSSGVGCVVLSNSQLVDVDDLGFKIIDRTYPLRQKLPPLEFVAALEVDRYRQVEAAYRAYRHRKADFFLDQGAVNLWGYDLLGQGRYREAVEVFKLNTTIFPKSAMTYDSLGEAYEKAGMPARAIASYRQVLERDNNAANALARLHVLKADADGPAQP